ncbi:hypothetical protein SERLA73DRAFT_139502, partial [Serpula lacrymans var. lacrymans S7.3]
VKSSEKQTSNRNIRAEEINSVHDERTVGSSVWHVAVFNHRSNRHTYVIH